MIKYILLDFDGTMGETEGTIIETFHTAIKEGMMEERDDASIKATIGIPLFPAFKVLYPGISDEKAKELVNLYRQNYIKKVFLTLKPMPGLIPTLEELKRRDKKMAVVSSRFTEMILKLCDCLKIRDYFDCFIGEEVVKNPKPAPDMAKLALTVLGADKDEAIMVGDTHFDIAMGNACGIKTCWASYGYGKKETVLPDKPTYTINSFSELLKIVD